jgi:succinate dehydrogenase/fumarate reductase flavoprotein subunit
LLDQIKKRTIPILLEHKVSKIIREKLLEGNVIGVKIQTKDKKLYFNAKKAVIIASGGFAGNRKMVANYDRRLTHTPTTNHQGASGECIKMAQDIGAEVTGMDYIQCIPKTSQPPFQGFFFAISSRELQEQGLNEASYKIFINKKGKRFVREDGPRDMITSAAFTQQPFKPVPSVKGETIKDLERKLELPKGHLVQSVTKYNTFCDAKKDQDFGKAPHLLIHCKTPPFVATTKIPARHYTMGGLKVKGLSGQVIDRWGNPIPQLYAAGEVTGGIHGLNRLGHNATLECIVFGRKTGETATLSAKQKKLTEKR